MFCESMTQVPGTTSSTFGPSSLVGVSQAAWFFKAKNLNSAWFLSWLERTFSRRKSNQSAATSYRTLLSAFFFAMSTTGRHDKIHVRSFFNGQLLTYELSFGLSYPNISMEHNYQSQCNIFVKPKKNNTCTSYCIEDSMRRLVSRGNISKF